MGRSKKVVSRYKRIDTHFRPIDLDLYEFVMNQVNGYGDASQVVREAIACLRQVQSLAAAAGLNWQEWIQLAATVMKSINVANPESEVR